MKTIYLSRIVSNGLFTVCLIGWYVLKLTVLEV